MAAIHELELQITNLRRHGFPVQPIVQDAIAARKQYPDRAFQRAVAADHVGKIIVDRQHVGRRADEGTRPQPEQSPTRRPEIVRRLLRGKHERHDGFPHRDSEGRRKRPGKDLSKQRRCDRQSLEDGGRRFLRMGERCDKGQRSNAVGMIEGER